MSKVYLLGLVAALLPSLASADQCRAVHYLRSNTAGGGIGGGTVTTSNGIYIYAQNNAQIGSYVTGDMDDPICGHDIQVTCDAPFATYTGHTTCDTLSIRDCSGDYGGVFNIPGAVNNGDDYYGIGVSTSSQCQVLFDC